MLCLCLVGLLTAPRALRAGENATFEARLPRRYLEGKLNQGLSEIARIPLKDTDFTQALVDNVQCSLEGEEIVIHATWDAKHRERVLSTWTPWISAHGDVTLTLAAGVARNQVRVSLQQIAVEIHGGSLGTLVLQPLIERFMVPRIRSRVESVLDRELNGKKVTELAQRAGVGVKKLDDCDLNAWLQSNGSLLIRGTCRMDD